MKPGATIEGGVSKQSEMSPFLLALTPLVTESEPGEIDPKLNWRAS